MKKQITPKDAVKKLATFKTREEIHSYIQENFAGPDNRFVRQEIAEILTGSKPQLVKCGLMHLTEFAHDWNKSQPKAEEIDFTSLVGKEVTRKQCGRKGKVDAYADGKLRITLEDGSVRTPASYRFKGLYNLQTA